MTTNLKVLQTILAGCLIYLFIGLSHSAQSAPRVGTIGDGTPGSCTEAALDTALAGGGTVTFNCGSAPKVIIVSATKVIATNTTIDGGGLITLSGNNAVRVLKINTGIKATLKNLTISAGLAANNYGGGIRNSGTLIIDNCRIENNQTSGNGSIAGGGGISNEGTLTITNSIIDDNRSVLGGGINTNGPTLILNTQIHDNIFDESGGGVFIYVGGNVVISNSRIYSNTAFDSNAHDGGGIYSVDRLALINSSVHHNQSNVNGGGIFNQGTVAITRTTISHNQTGYGAGLYNVGQARVTNATFDFNNSSANGSGLYTSGGALTVTQSTINGNHADGDGGGLEVYSGSAFLQNTTLSDNSSDASGGGLMNYQGTVLFNNDTVYTSSLYPTFGTFSLKNTVIANSLCVGYGTMNSLGFNLADNTTCNLIDTGDQPNVAAQLGPLQNNGGPTLTHMPLSGSHAIDHGSGCPAIDQRGAPRPIGAACDVGAVEYGSVAPLDRNVYLPLALK